MQILDERAGMGDNDALGPPPPRPSVQAPYTNVRDGPAMTAAFPQTAAMYLETAVAQRRYSWGAAAKYYRSRCLGEME